jgi:N-acetylmuramoyl-L-alanine amidase
MNDSIPPQKPDEGTIPIRTVPPPRPASQEPPTQPPAPQPHKPSRFAFFSAVQSIIGVTILVATLFTLFTPRNLISGQMFNSIIVALQSTPEVDSLTPTRASASDKPLIGIVAGHDGHDSGTVCSDGLTEASVNMKIATLVRQNLIKQGYNVDLLQEFDTKLSKYHALALISIHNDSCDYINDEATGFKVSAAQATKYPEKTSRLEACLINRYASITGLPFHSNTITADMSQYHAFGEVDPSTPSVIIETGFLNLDRQILTSNTGLIAEGVTAGILCFTRNEIIPTKEAEIK